MKTRLVLRPNRDSPEIGLDLPIDCLGSGCSRYEEDPCRPELLVRSVVIEGIEPNEALNMRIYSLLDLSGAVVCDYVCRDYARVDSYMAPVVFGTDLEAVVSEVDLLMKRKLSAGEPKLVIVWGQGVPSI